MQLGPLPVEVVVVVLLASAAAALTDVWRFKVYNLLTIPVFLSGLVYHAVDGGWVGLALATVGAAFGFVVFLIPYSLGGMGAGDVKFVMALGAWLGIGPLAVVVFFGCLATGLYSLALLLRTGGFRQVWFNLQLLLLRIVTVGRFFVPDDKVECCHDWTADPKRRLRLIPFSAMIAIGVVITLLLTFNTIK